MNSLGSRLVVAVVSVFSIVLGVATYGAVRSTRHEYLEFYGAGSAIALDILGHAIERSLEREDGEAIRDLMGAAQASPSVDRLVLFDDVGHILHAVPAQSSPVDPFVLSLRDQSRDAGAPVGDRSGRRGDATYVTVRALDAAMACSECGGNDTRLYLAGDVSLWALWDYVRRQGWWLATTLLGASGVVAIVLLLMVRRWVLTPVERLRGGMARVEQGDLDAFLDDQGSAELAQVTSAFNMMVARLAAARRAVEHLEPDGQARSHNALTLNTLASTLAHELRSPLAGISGTLQLMGSDLEDGHPREALVEEAIHQVERVTRELDDLLVYARPAEMARAKMVDLGVLVARVVAFLGAQARGEGVDLRSAIDASQVEMQGDADRLEQIVLNLVQNALQAVSAHDGSVRRVDVAVVQVAGGVQLTVSDTGPGIGEAEREHVFEPFYTTRREGTGLGLPIVRRLVEDHGGRVRVRAAPSGGAEFIVWFPLPTTGEEGVG